MASSIFGQWWPSTQPALPHGWCGCFSTERQWKGRAIKGDVIALEPVAIARQDAEFIWLAVELEPDAWNLRLRGVAVRRMVPGLRGWQAWRIDVGDAGAEEKSAGPLETQFDATRRAHTLLDKLQMPVPVRLKHG